MHKVVNFLKEVGIEHNDLNWYERAFSHTSYINEHQNLKQTDNQRLEFLGDAVFDLVIGEYLFFKENTLNEGKMTKLRAIYVCEKALFYYAKKLKFNDYVKLGRGELINGGAMRPAILADAFEAFLGALYIDKGLVTVKEFVNQYIIPIIESDEFDEFHDFKTELQELIQTHKRTIIYEIISEKGPAHHREFEAIAKLDDIILGKGVGFSKKNAEQQAAKSALEKLAKVDG